MTAGLRIYSTWRVSCQLPVGVLLAADVEAAVKHAGLRTLMNECGRAHEAVVGLAEEFNAVESVEKLVAGPGGAN